MKRKHLHVSVALLLLGLAACNNNGNHQMGYGPMPFPVQKIKQSNITTYTEYAANIEGIQNVEIRPKVEGFVDKIYIDEGEEVVKGQILFKLSAETLDQQAKAAFANIKVAEAQVQKAQVEVEKITPLVQKDIVSSIQLKTAESNLVAAKAQLLASKANYQNAKENLAYTSISSPVDGIVGSLPYKVGSLVGRSETNPLTTVSNIEEVYAYFTLNEKQLLDFNRNLNGTTVDEKIKQFPEIELILADGSTYKHKGKIESINGMVNPRTGSISYRATFPNPENLLRSGISGKVKIPTYQKNVITVPQKATFELQGKKFIYLLGKENKIQSKEIQISNTLQEQYIVSNGVEKGQQFVSDGLIKLREGMEIIPQENGGKAEANVAFSKK